MLQVGMFLARNESVELTSPIRGNYPVKDEPYEIIDIDLREKVVCVRLTNGRRWEISADRVETMTEDTRDIRWFVVEQGTSDDKLLNQLLEE